MNAIFTGLLGISNGLGDTSAFLPQADEFDYLAAGARAGKDYRSGLAIEARQARIDQNLQFVRHDPASSPLAAKCETRWNTPRPRPMAIAAR
jgi:hypothetical protein